MKASTFTLAVVIVAVLGFGAWFYLNMNASWSMAQSPTDAAGATVPEGTGAPVGPADQPVSGAPSVPAGPAGASGAAGVNGSVNQGNMGAPATGVVQQPGADGAEGSIIGSALALNIGTSEALGKFITAYNNMTVYLYTKDTGKDSTCYQQCATNWPPYLVGAEDNLNNVVTGVNPDKVGSTMRTDGGIQVTYDGHPLYFWIKDKKAGDTTGQGVGSVWYVLKP